MKFWQIFLLGIAHLILGQILYRVPLASTAYACFIFLAGFYWAIRGNVPNLVYTAAYLVGIEVLFRMTGARVFWEFGKYSVGALLLTYLITRGWRSPLLPLTYFSLLLPSAVFLPLIIQIVDRTNLSQISGNLSGPFLLMVCVIFFNKIRLTLPQLQKTLLFIIFPVLSVLSIAGYMTYTAEDIYFSSASNAATSGGFGPNQVSSMFGLGALAVYLFFFIAKGGLLQKVFLFLIGISFATQSALTFSRSGVYLAVLASLAATFYLVRKRSNFFKIAIIFSVLFAIAHFFIWPRLVNFTEGAIEKRFKETSMTNRESLAQQDLNMFFKNPILGVGPGQSTRHRSSELVGTAGHTEFSRVLAEHGIFGLFSIVALLVLSFNIYSRKKSPLAQAVSTACLVWAFLFMSVNAMRIAAPSFIIGFAAVRIIEISPALLRQLLDDSEKKENAE